MANVHELSSSVSSIEQFQAAFNAFYMHNLEANKTSIDMSVVADDNQEELHIFIVQKFPKKL